MTPTSPMKRTLAPPKIAAAEILRALGLERRRSTGGKLAVGLGLLAAGALVGAGAVLLRAVLLDHDRPGASDNATELDPGALA
jgi:hypothetical protein